VKTEAAEGVKETEATLRGTVNPEGYETKYYFEYGTEKGKYTSKTEEASAGSGTSSVKVSKAITGLTASTTYYYRLVATNANAPAGVDGAEQSFTTHTKPTVETRAATGIVGTEATLNGVVDPRGSETTYYFEYGLASEKAKYEHTTAGASAGSGASNVEVSGIISELAPKTEYRFRIVATNAGGTSDRGPAGVRPSRRRSISGLTRRFVAIRQN
jgi:hypothetical protein